jgi:glycosyltransferase involved in cell wall biosynthesis
MRIGFDAKRAFFNQSGLGNYSRDTINILAEYFPENELILYSPNPLKSKIFYKASNVKIKGPTYKWQSLFGSFWRTYSLSKQLTKEQIELYHGLSNELPVGIEKINIPSVVTIHDLIFMRYPEFYKSFDRTIYEKKFRYAALHASKVIAVSGQTRDDLMKFFSVPPHKIEVVYQGCNPIFWQTIKESKKNEILEKYHIPENYILYVGTIEERKNLLNIIKALDKGKIDYPLVVIGRPTEYLFRVKEYIEQQKVKQVYFLEQVPNEDLPAIYQMAHLFVYPSVFEGFGIPILEALTSKVPVITSKGGCFAEAAGKSSIYIDPQNIEELTDSISLILNNSTLRYKMIEDGYSHAQEFSQEKIARNLMKVYKELL